MRALVFGSDHITVGTLKHMIQCSSISHLEVVTPSSSKKSPPIQFCSQHRIPYHVLPKSTDFRLSGFELPSPSTSKVWDIGIVASFGYLVPLRVIESFRSGMLNVHPSLLPQYIGSAPIPYALLNGDRITGVSIIDLVPKLDGGPILKQNIQCIEEEDTFSSLSHKLADLGGQSLCEVLSDLDQYRLHSVPQSENEAKIKALYREHDSDWKEEEFRWIKTRKIQKNWSLIDWRLSAKSIVNRHRAINGLLKNSRSVLGTKVESEKLLILIDEMKEYRMESDDDDHDDIEDAESPLFTDDEDIGSIVYCKDRNVLFVKCGVNEDGRESVLEIHKLRIAPSLASQHLANFDQFVREFGHFVPFCDDKEYAQRHAPYLKNHF